MKRIVRLTESDLARIVRRVIKEEGEQSNPNNREQYYDMMKKGKCPDVILTYKKDGAWFDDHTSTSLFDMASSVGGLNLSEKWGNGTLGEYLLMMVRLGKHGIKCGSNGYYILKPEDRLNDEADIEKNDYEGAPDNYDITKNLVKRFAGKGSPK